MVRRQPRHTRSPHTRPAPTPYTHLPCAASAQSWLFGGPAAHVSLELNPIEGRKPKYIDYGEGSDPVPCPVYEASEDITGTVEVHVPAGRSLEHQGVVVSLRGVIDLYYDRGNPQEFCHDVISLEPAGTLTGVQKYTFSIPAGSRAHESYNGINVRTRYFVTAAVQRGVSTLSKEQEVLVQCLAVAYHLSDVVTGRINFLLVRIKIKHMEVTIIRREKAGTASHVYNESDTLTKFEVMDGAPVRGEVIPVRLYLSGFDLTPTYASVYNRYSVRYFLNLVLVDDKDRRYFKQHEIKLWRKKVK
ncbi:vps26 [Symbiodinium sp. KB8]|nr:vps26 [Symbiodinium sp. KB8]